MKGLMVLVLLALLLALAGLGGVVSAVAFSPGGVHAAGAIGGATGACVTLLVGLLINGEAVEP